MDAPAGFKEFIKVVAEQTEGILTPDECGIRIQLNPSDTLSFWIQNADGRAGWWVGDVCLQPWHNVHPVNYRVKSRIPGETRNVTLLTTWILGCIAAWGPTVKAE